MNEYKKIVLLSGLQSISDYHFRVLKSLLTPDLQLNKKMQDDYDRIKIADLMEEKFQSDAGLSILIELFQNIPELGDLVHTLRKQMEKGNTGAAWMSTLYLPSPTLLSPCSVYGWYASSPVYALGPIEWQHFRS